MEELRQLKDALVSERPASWKEFPDIGLYKDQVVAYISKQLIRFHDEELLTSAMINNYIKDKLLPRADGKKYSKEHLAGLIEICILKQVLSVRNTGFLLNQVLGESNQEIFYERFKEDFDDSLARVAEQIETNWSLQDLSDIALRMAISSYCDKLVCERLIEIIRSKTKPEQINKSEKSDKKPDKHQNNQEQER
ncbi:MAG: DUF1836 domain-containing protein [Caldicoprobacterales bacterium]|nr:DUF1836 domain-containing protein [Clostridiales bacterium]